MGLPARRVPDHVGKPAFKITPEVLGKVEVLAEQGMPKVWAARLLGISIDTFNSKLKNFPQFANAWELGAAKLLQKVSLGRVTNALTPTPFAPGGMLAAQNAIYDSIVGKQGVAQLGEGEEVQEVTFRRITRNNAQAD